jgi:hypothetical protein
MAIETRGPEWAGQWPALDAAEVLHDWALARRGYLVELR